MVIIFSLPKYELSTVFASQRPLVCKTVLVGNEWLSVSVLRHPDVMRGRTRT